jgi:hypothetical protein
MPSIITRGAASATGFGFGSGKSAPAITFGSVSSPFGSGFPQSLATNGYQIVAVLSNASQTYPVWSESNIATFAFSTPATFNGSTSQIVYDGLCYGAGVFVAVGENTSSGSVGLSSCLSTNLTGTSWYSPTSFGVPRNNNQLEAVTYDTSAGLFVAVGNYVSAYSNNGSTWTVVNWPSSNIYMNSVAFNPSGVGVALGYNTVSPVACYSSNGTSWSTATTLAGSAQGLATSVVWNPIINLFVGMGYLYNTVASTYYPARFTSPDGVSWTSGPVITNTTTGVMEGIAVNSSGLMVAVGYVVVSGSEVPLYCTSTNGTTWSKTQAFTGVSAGYAKRIVCGAGGVFAVLGQNTSTTTPWIVHS